MDLLEKYWVKNGKKANNLIIFIDNHKSKCQHATTYLNEYLYGIKPEEVKPKKSRKSKKKSKKKKKIMKKKKKSSVLKNEVLKKIENEKIENPQIEEEQPEQNELADLKNGGANQSKTDFHVFHYTYMEENIDYRK